ncbi:MarR family winged helix-turn-helix transcriptional regulator [Acetobacterium wieringae]|uniref:MarR family winged helix-turn-helix transcriptional regulator n=1 Tax=Acetobacterium wieringae TaxID=52694 RepID=UPI0026F298B7|nr:MarR family transcriptional regulator [Acetobacterium wieringae]
MKTDQFNFGGFVKQLNNIMEMRFNHSLKQWNLTSSQFSVIMYLLHHQDQEINQKMIEEAFRLKGPTVTGIVKRLVEKEFIQRRPDSQDRRINYLELTKKGLALESLVCTEITRLEAETLRDISPEHLNLLESLLHQILKNITDPNQ